MLAPAFLVLAAVALAPPLPELDVRGPAPEPEPIDWRQSRAVGAPAGGRLVAGVRLPASGPDHATWDPVLRRSPNRSWRRWGTDDLVLLVLHVARTYRERHPEALPRLVGDLSRRRGGEFGVRYGGSLGHSSHQNGLDVDVYYPRRDRRPAAPRTVGQVDRKLAQELVDLFVAAGAQRVLVGPNLPLTGPREVVAPWPNHDNHLHVRIANPGP